MNRYRMRFAPHVWKPSLSPTLVRWLKSLRTQQCNREVCIADFEVSGDDIVRRHLDAGHGVMLMPNHSSHADPYVIYAAADLIGTPLLLMATWHVFHEKSRLVQWLLRKHGCFSVDREANDIGAFKLASGLLQQEPHPLVIFPEGEIYHCSDRVTPFREGAAAIAVAAARKSDRPIVCIPCAISYRYVDDPTPALTETMGRLEESIFWRRQTNRSLEERIYRFAEALLAVKELEYYGETKSGRLPERIRAFGDFVLDAVEARHELACGNKSIPERVKAARKAIIEKRSADELVDADRSRLDDDLEDLFLVVQSFSYPGDYVGDKPSIERVAETIDKFEEDVLKEPTASIKARRKVKVMFGEAVEVIGDKKVKGQTTEITTQIEARVQGMLDSIHGESQ
ncbi:Acyltransferase [Rubripirellula lacrimiformis]|uniref:Acyltransferase n=1 Tax=Rubripirellula lacrimiformis TaxID=1930273 RepID=A0A517NEM0_9BACT|nr:1-acyl-sn-glycerol-3-phosphate acyltransferase [Rubripirellula lacrimiformis]QDT05584.1 Acyltransferase [Rubripirellula lacrimiformis]